MPLCGFCRLLTVQKLEGFLEFHADLASLRKSAETGCDFCILCWKGFQKEWKAEDIESVLKGGVPQGYDDFDPSIWISGHFEDRGPRQTVPQIKVSCGKVNPANGSQVNNIGLGFFELAVYVKEGSPAESYIPGRLCTVDHEPGLYISMIRQWIQRCETSHKVCSPEDDYEMPTRLIDVGDPHNGIAPRLVIVDPKMRENYLALSYCWGPATDTFTLNAGTMKGMLSGIQVSSLVAAHSDVLTLARSLGFRFVWIDALCIIQGDIKDWESESRRMGKVYGNATLTVVAGRSIDARNSFITNNLKQAAPPCEIPMDASNNSGSAFLALRRSTHIGPVETRGWCLQEQILSRRIIIFGQDQLIFNCQARSDWEDGQGFTKNNMHVSPAALRALDPKLTAQRDRLLHKWYTVLIEYTKRQLSNPNDIFAAIASVVTLISEALESRYLAGIWECDLIFGLLWKPSYQMHSHYLPATRPTPTTLAPAPVIRAPSWSWAAIQGSVHGAGRRSFLQKAASYQGNSFIKVKSKLQNPERWSPDTKYDTTALHMPSCELQLLGRIAQAAVLDTPAIEYLKIEGWTRSNTKTVAVRRHGVLLGRIDAKQDGTAADLTNAVVAIGRFDFAAEQVQEVWCLQLIPDEGLMLRRGEDGKFRRAGLFLLVDEDWFDGLEEVDISLV